MGPLEAQGGVKPGGVGPDQPGKVGSQIRLEWTRHRTEGPREADFRLDPMCGIFNFPCFEFSSPPELGKALDLDLPRSFN